MDAVGAPSSGKISNVQETFFSDAPWHPVGMPDRVDGGQQHGLGPFVAVFSVGGPMLLSTPSHIERLFDEMKSYKEEGWQKSVDRVRDTLDGYCIAKQPTLASALLFPYECTSLKLYIPPSSKYAGVTVEPLTPTIENPHGITLLDLITGIVDACTSSPHPEAFTSMRIGGVHWREDGLLEVDELGE